MFGLTQHNQNGALVATTGLALTPLASALQSIGYNASQARELTLPNLGPETASSEWSEWLTSGYVGNFLGWVGKQLAEIGRDLFPEYSTYERQKQMDMSEEELKQLMTESLLEQGKEGELDAGVETKIKAVLGNYLRQGIALVNRDALDLEEWRVELISLRDFASRMRQDEIAQVFAESVEQIDLRISNQKMEQDVETRTFELSPSLNGYQYPYSAYEEEYSIHARTAFPNSFDVAGLTASSNPSGFKLSSSVSSGKFGISVSTAGDVNGDGYADLIVGAYYENGGQGASYVVFGQGAIFPNNFDVAALTATSNPSGFKLSHSVSPGNFGISVSAAGDVNGDGYADLIVGAHNENGTQGAAYVVFGQGATFPNSFDVTSLTAASNPRGFKLTPPITSRRFGASVSVAGDVNKDGYVDLIVGAYYENSGQGASYVIFGQASPFPNTFDVSGLTATSNPRGFKLSSALFSLFGASVSAAGDVNKDGYADLIVGAYNENSGQGASYVVLGQASPFPNTFNVAGLTATSNPRGFKLSSSISSAFFGISVSTAGDVNGDGYADLIVGAQNENSAQGASYVVLGQASPFPNTFDVAGLTAASNPRGFKLSSLAAFGLFGDSVSTIGDVNGDGYADLIVGARYENSHQGASYVVFGQGTTFPNSFDVASLTSTSNPRGFKLSSLVSNGNFGRSVSAAGDVNGDGKADFIIGAHDENSHQGASYVVFGETSSTVDLAALGTKGFTVNGAVAGDFSGYSVSAAGDVNGDGVADILIGARHASPLGRTEAGQSYVVFGRMGLAGTVIDLGALGNAGFTVNGAVAGDRSGYSISGAGDVNADGVADIIIGAWYANPFGPSPGWAELCGLWWDGSCGYGD